MRCTRTVWLVFLALFVAVGLAGTPASAQGKPGELTTIRWKSVGYVPSN